MTQAITPDSSAQGSLGNPISISAVGAERAVAAIAGSGKPNAGVRLFIKSGGCSGYQYGMAIDDRELDGDTILQDRGVKLIVDRMSLPLVQGAEIDYVENMMGGGFTVNNPNATSACGCGHSFRTDGAEAQAGEGSSGCGSH
jgi:iron-sulfur cluster assembly protein